MKRIEHLGAKVEFDKQRFAETIKTKEAECEARTPEEMKAEDYLQNEFGRIQQMEGGCKTSTTLKSRS